MTRQRSSAPSRSDRAEGSSTNTHPVLPAHVNGCLQRLPAAAQRLLSIRDRFSVRARMAAEGFTQALDPLVDYLASLMRKGAGLAGSIRQGDSAHVAAAAAVLASGAVREALLRLVAVGVRLPPELLAPAGPDITSPNVYGRAFVQTSVAAMLLLVNASEEGNASRPPLLTVTDFAHKLLRMDTLQASSRQLAAAAAAPVPVAAFAVHACFGLLHGLICYAKYEAGLQQQARLPSTPFCTELVAALQESCVLEHCAKLLLAAEQAAVAEQHLLLGTRATLSGAVQNFTCALLNLIWLRGFFRLTANTAAAAQVTEVLSGRCVQHVTVVHGLAALCMTDSGPSYGLPGELLSWVPAVIRAGNLPTKGAALVTNSVAAAIQVLDPAIRTHPVGRRAALALLMRMGRLAVVWGQAWAAESGIGPSSTSAAALVAPELLGGLNIRNIRISALEALRVAQLHLRPLQPGSAADLVQEVVEWWRLLGDVVSHVLLSPKLDVQELAGSMGAMQERVAQPRTERGDVCMLPEPPPDAAAALEGGALPCLERLLRRAGQDPGSTEATLVRETLNGTVLLPTLLVYGEERQVAAVVVTVGKLLRVADAWFFGDMDIFVSAMGLVDAALGMAESCLAFWMRTLREAAATEGGIAAAIAASAPLRQVLLLASCALCEWMPPMVRLLRGAMERHGSVVPAVLETVTFWLGALATRCMDVGGAGDATVHCEGAEDTGGGSTSVVASASASRDAPTQGGDGHGVGDMVVGGDPGWGHLIPPEEGAVPLLGRALRRRSVMPSRLRWRVLAASCCATAAAFPEQVRQAAVAAAAGDPESGWRPELLRALVPKPAADAADPGGGLGEEDSSGVDEGGEGEGEAADAVEVLAAELESWCTAGDSDGEGRIDMGCLMRLRSAACSAARETTVVAAALVSPAELRLRQLLRTCSNPACENLAGNSEAELGLRACGRCGAVKYCCRECQTAHWKAGHKEACRVGRGG